ncbi:MAG TPA: RagB/SusD family nutrient uptake outer membrane protein [Gemmatimonadales bacterium]|nr:RagB/SusD family nutrient uptake outer membrane protein [Gemmatimonadales bacterium]
MTIRFALAFALVVSLAGCNSMLDQDPIDRLPDSDAITNARGARAALVGAYNALESSGYYGEEFTELGDLPADNADHTGTSQAYDDADANQFRADNASAQSIWNTIYDAINRVNVILERVPAVTDLDDTEKNQILGEAHFLRALHYHNLVKLYGDVPIRLTPVKDVNEAGSAVRSPVADVYTQILADLSDAGTLITSTAPTTQATVDAVNALLARVRLYQQDYAAAVTAADAVIPNHSLAASYSDLFDAEGQDTPEDIFKVTFTAVQFNWLGYDYITETDGGNGAVAPAQNLIDAYDPTDARLAWNITFDSDGAPSGTKWPTTFGAEDLHVIRLAEVLLIKAEALARQSDLQGAVDTYNLIRERAGLADHVLGVDVTTQADVLAAIDRERRLELAFEGDRWPDLVRTGQAVTVLGIPEFQTLFPIPQSERDVSPGVTQNPGY